MRSRISLLGLLSVFIFFVASVYSWDATDHEIFDLVSALEADEGKGTTFYKFLDLPKSATLDEIKKASRKLSLALHPDKHPNDKKVEVKFTRLRLISAILKDEEKRKRYNFFHDNGVPRWKGTRYMYSRWQPGLGFAISFVLLVASLMQYAAQHVNYRTEIKRIQRFQAAAIQAAYRKGDKPAEGTKMVERKKVKIPIGQANGQESESETMLPKSRQERRRMQQAGGLSKAPGAKPTQPGWIDMVVEGDNVWIVSEDGSELPLVESAASTPGFKKTFIPALINSILGRFLPQNNPSEAPFRSDDHTALSDEKTEAEEDLARNSQIPDETTKASQAKSRKGTKPKKN